MSTLATIQTARLCVTHQGTEQWAIETICKQSDFDVHPTEVIILRNDKKINSMRYVLFGATIIGSYSLKRTR